MILSFCAVCGTENDLQQHHIEPVVFSKIGRTNKKRYDPNKKLKECTPIETFAWLFDQGVITEKGTITVCGYHHNLLHGIVKFQKAEHSVMIKEGIKIAVSKGKKLGRPSTVTDDLKNQVVSCYKNGMSINKITKQFKIGTGTTRKILINEDGDIIRHVTKR